MLEAKLGWLIHPDDGGRIAKIASADHQCYPHCPPVAPTSAAVGWDAGELIGRLENQQKTWSRSYGSREHPNNSCSNPPIS